MPLTPAPGGGVHDRPTPLLEQQRNLVLHAQEHATEVDIDDPVPVCFRELGHRLNRLFDAGVVEGEVEAPERLDGPVQRTFHLFGPCHVAPDAERAPAVFFDQARGFPEVRFRNVGHRHVSAYARKGQRRRAANAAPGPGDKSHFASEGSVPIQGHKFFLLVLFTAPGSGGRESARPDRQPEALTGSPGRPLPARVLSQTLHLLTASTVTLTDPGTLKASTPESILPIRMMPGSGICSPSFR